VGGAPATPPANTPLAASDQMTPVLLWIAIGVAVAAIGAGVFFYARSRR
jgi:hypothetical protein